ncbi:hypothetical protein J6P92_03580 [bacterium]|nr:hypothetical protein [bacterium]
MDVIEEIENIANLSKTLFDAMMFNDVNDSKSNNNLTLACIISQRL